MKLVETGIEQGNDDRNTPANGGLSLACRSYRNCGGKEKTRYAEQKVEKDVRKLTDIEPEYNGYPRCRHPGRDLDAQEPEEPLPYAVARPRRRRPLLPRKKEDDDHHRQHWEDGEEKFKSKFHLLILFFTDKMDFNKPI